ncbi:OpgC domain-containing protein (plasmid) [Azospirillum argentinense]|uniref:OpgC domain-containing protein n=3 Tax=Azospirillum TaxID=191 RepID=A0A2K1G4B4_9PROT|nr:OpgC domain-containing protein [Azospirillum argentinense]QCN98763.1 OpgC domain-containing protein [Azospirillum argentinense]QCO05308.1 OpgC domain-containing protein [Azospirillum argentinense]
MASGGMRDLRLDFFRGLALWFIFVDHIPGNQIAWVTMRNFGLSDATEVFVFISGYTSSLVYSRILEQHGWRFAAAKVLDRCWTLYIAYLFLFIAFTAQVAYTARVFDNPLFTEEMGIAGFFADPAVSLVQALALKFRPANLDILPLYIVLLLSLPVVLPVLRRWPLALLAGSVTLYAAARLLDWNLPTYPDGGVWFFNPFAWQLLFVLGATMQRLPKVAAALTTRRTALLWLAGGYLFAALLLVISWQVAPMAALMPVWLAEILYPISKTDLDLLRLAHFCALAYVVLQIARFDSAWLRWPALAPVILCGRQSLQVFCLGIFLSFAGQTVLNHWSASLFAQFSVTLAGIAVMVAAARVLTWYQSVGRPPRPSASAPPAAPAAPLAPAAKAPAKDPSA